MKTIRGAWFSLAVLVLLGLAAQACAVELKAGWYARFGYVLLSGRDSLDSEWGVDWYPASLLGQSGPILVQDGAPLWRGRTVSISANASMEPHVLFEDYGTYSGPYPYYQSVQIGWQTDYDASRMQLQVFRHRGGQGDELVWSQTRSGVAQGSGNIWLTSPLLSGESVVFRVVAVPEPSGTLAFFALLIPCLPMLRRRR